MKKTFMLSISFFGICFFSCKKSSTAGSVLEKLQHTWIMVTHVDNDTPDGSLKTTYGTSQDILIFNKDGTVINHLYGYNDSAFYSILDGNKIVVNIDNNISDNDTAKIETLTDTQLILSDDNVDAGIKSTTTFKR